LIPKVKSSLVILIQEGPGEGDGEERRDEGKGDNKILSLTITLPPSSFTFKKVFALSHSDLIDIHPFSSNFS
jgi:hypothetical protein